MDLCVENLFKKFHAFLKIRIPEFRSRYNDQWSTALVKISTIYRLRLVPNDYSFEKLFSKWRSKLFGKKHLGVHLERRDVECIIPIDLFMANHVFILKTEADMNRICSLLTIFIYLIINSLFSIILSSCILLLFFCVHITWKQWN